MTIHKVLVTGADGALGNSLLQHLKRKGLGIRVLLLPGRSKPALVDECVWGDVRDRASMDVAVEGVDAVIHMAGLILSQSASLFQDINTNGTGNLVQACQQNHVQRFIHISSISVTYSQRNAYAESKWKAEELVRNSGLDWTILRPTLLVGKGGGAEYLKFIRLLKLPLIPLPGGGTSLKRPIHVDDLSRGIASVLLEPKSIGKTYAMAGFHIYTLRQMLENVADDLGKSRPIIVPVPSFLAQALARLMDFFPGKISAQQTMMGFLENANPGIESARQDFGFSPQSLQRRWLA